MDSTGTPSPRKKENTRMLGVSEGVRHPDDPAQSRHLQIRIERDVDLADR